MQVSASCSPAATIPDILPENSSGLGDQTRTSQNVAGDRRYFQRPPCVERWLRNKAPLTQQRYPRYLNRFQLLTDLTPEQFPACSKTVDSVEVQDRNNSSDGARLLGLSRFKILSTGPLWSSSLLFSFVIGSRFQLPMP